MPMYDVTVYVSALACVTVEADDEIEAEDYARDCWSTSDLQCGIVESVTMEVLSDVEAETRR